MEEKSKGLSLSVILTIIFVVLKLCHVIEWSWIWVLSPLWIGAALIVAIAIILYILTKI